MLVLSRKVNERVCIGDNVEICVVDIRGDKVRLGIEAPAAVPVHRKEVRDAIERSRQAEAPPAILPAEAVTDSPVDGPAV